MMTEGSEYHVTDSESALPPRRLCRGAILFPALWSSTLHGAPTADNARTALA